MDEDANGCIHAAQGLGFEPNMHQAGVYYPLPMGTKHAEAHTCSLGRERLAKRRAVGQAGLSEGASRIRTKSHPANREMGEGHFVQVNELAHCILAP